jgi:hypothetical protein
MKYLGGFEGDFEDDFEETSTVFRARVASTSNLHPCEAEEQLRW